MLSQHPDVKAVVAAVQHQSSEHSQLVAYINPQAAALSLSELRRFAQTKLPDYMVPGAFYQVDDFPLTVNGKIDRQALVRSGPPPEPMELVQNNQPSTEQSTTKPRDPLEYQLLEIWKAVLGQPALGVTDNFFEAGGHSLLAVRLFLQVEKIFGQSLPLTILFQAPTVAQLAEIVRQGRYAIAQPPVIEFQQGSKPSALICLPGIFGSFFYCYGLAHHMGAEQSIYAVREPGRYGETVGFRTIADLAAYYVQSITTFQPQGPYFLAGYSYGGLVLYEVAQQLQSQGREIGLLALLEPTVPILPAWLRWYYQHSPGSTDFRTLWYYLTLLELSFAQKCMISLKAVVNPRFVNDTFVAQQRLSHEQQYLTTYLKTIVSSIEQYRPQPYAGELHLFLTNSRQRSRSCRIWSKLAQKEAVLHQITGRHGTIGDEPHVQVLAEQLQACLESLPGQEKGSP